MILQLQQPAPQGVASRALRASGVRAFRTGWKTGAASGAGAGAGAAIGAGAAVTEVIATAARRVKAERNFILDWIGEDCGGGGGWVGVGCWFWGES